MNMAVANGEREASSGATGQAPTCACARPPLQAECLHALAVLVSVVGPPVVPTEEVLEVVLWMLEVGSWPVHFYQENCLRLLGIAR